MTMSRQQAAALLNVAESASRTEVQQAFRRAARDAHPDAGPSIEAISLQEAQEARNVLIGAPRVAGLWQGAPRPWPPKSAGTGPRATDASTTSGGVTADTDSPTSTEDKVDGAADFHERLREMSDKGANWVVMGTLSFVVVIFLIVGTILAIGAFFASDSEGGRPGGAPLAAKDCVEVSSAGLAAVDCGEPNAQRIVSTTGAVIDCPGGQNTLVVGTSTWCLELVAS